MIPVMLYWRYSQAFDKKTQHCLNALIKQTFIVLELLRFGRP